MNNFDLESKLRGVPVPERPGDYWEDFPSRIRRQLRSSRRVTAWERQESPSPRFFRGFGLGFACLLMGLLVFSQPLKAASHAVFQTEHSLRQQLASLPRQCRILMADEHGLHHLVTETE